MNGDGRIGSKKRKVNEGNWDSKREGVKDGCLPHSLTGIFWQSAGLNLWGWGGVGGGLVSLSLITSCKVQISVNPRDHHACFINNEGLSFPATFTAYVQ